MREHRCAIAVAPIMPNGAIFLYETQHPPNRVHAFGSGFRSNARARISPRGRRPRHRADGLTEHRVASDQGQSAQLQVFARLLHVLCDIAVQLSLELGVAEADKGSWSHKLERQRAPQRPIVVDGIGRDLEFAVLAKAIRDASVNARNWLWIWRATI